MVEKIGLEAFFRDAQFRSGIRRYNAAVDKANRSTTRGAGKMQKAWGGLGDTFAKLGIAIGVGVALRAIKRFVAESLTEFRDLEKGMAEVFTLMPDISDNAMGAMTRDVQQLSVEMGRLPKEVVPALYQSISAGVPPDNVFSFLETAHQAALGGVTDLETAVDGLTSVVNAYGEDVITAAEASDLMFTAVRGGKTTFQELSDSLFQIAPIAANLDIDFGNITAAMAAMTSQGVPTRTAAVQLRQLLIELSTSGKEAADTFAEIAGVGFRDFIAQGNNVQDALALLEEHADNAGIGINEMFGNIRAGQGALVLSGKGAAKYTEELLAAEDAAGATGEAAAKMNDTTQQAVNEAAAAWNDLKLAIGGAMNEADRSSAKARKNIFQLAADFIRTGTAMRRVADLVQTSTFDMESGLDDIANTAGEVQNAIKRNNDLTETYNSEAEQTAVRLAILEDLWSAGIPQAMELTRDGLADMLDKFEALEPDVRARLMEEMLDQFERTGRITPEATDGLSDFSQQELSLARRTQEATEAQEEQAEAIELVVDKTADYFGQLLSITDAQSSFNQLLIDQAIKMGLNANQVASLALQTGEYDRAQVQASLAMAEASTRADELYAQVEEGLITSEEAIALLDEEYGARIQAAQAMLEQDEAAKRRVEAAKAERAELEETKRALGELFLSELDVSYAADKDAEALLNAASQAGASVTDLVLLADAAYDLSDAQVEAALKAAVMQEKIKQLGQDIANNEITVAGARAELERFKGQVDEDYQMKVDTGDVDAATADVKGLQNSAATTTAERYQLKLGVTGKETVDTDLQGFETKATSLTERQYTAQIDADATPATTELGTLETETTTSVSGMETATGAGMTNVVGTIESGASDMVGVMQGAFEEVIAGAEASFGEIEGTIDASLAAGVAAGNSYKGEFFSVGANMIEGLRLGTISRRGPLYGTIRALIRGAVEVARLEAKITSPSRETQEIGELMGEGFEVGLAVATPAVLKAAGKLVTQLVTHWRTQLEDQRPALFEAITGVADELGRAGNTFVRMYEDQVLDPLKDSIDASDETIEQLEEQLRAALGIEDLDSYELVRRYFDALHSGNRKLVNQIEGLWAAQSRRNKLENEYAKEQERILALEEKRQQLDFLQTQFDLIRQLEEAGINPQDVLGGLELGLDAELPALIDAMTRGMAELIQAANDELGIASKSKVFSRIGRYIYEGLEHGLQQASTHPSVSASEVVKGINVTPILIPPANPAPPTVIVQGGETRQYSLQMTTRRSPSTVRRSFALMEMLDA